ncbi:MAG: 6-phosphofructokinase [Burkholderiales bacterium]|jgi:6-phosphofructokinase 1|nr:6-phosphofructokinase [Burkholderiales bacterium]
MQNAIYAQSGGVTSVINASACGVITACLENSDKIGTLYAAENGILGVLHEQLIDISYESSADIAKLRHTPGGAFGSCRYKLKGLEQNRLEYERLIEIFRAYDIGYFFYNGGNDSADTCLKVSQIADELGYPIKAIHIPKTIDNDLVVTDNCPGFGSVAKYIATSICEAGFDLESMCLTSTKVFILEVMGRNAGWIAASSGLASSNESEAPHIILFPEIVFDEDLFITKVDTIVKMYGYCVITVSEGIKNKSGELISNSQQVTDDFGHKQLGGVAPIIADIVKRRLNLKYHWAVADYLQRSARHISSAIDVEQAYALGFTGVKLALIGHNAIMPYIKRISQEPYGWEIDYAPLTEIANKEKQMPRDFITQDGFHITNKCRDYLLPLIMGEDFPPFINGLPDYVRLKKHKVQPKLPAFGS